MALAIAKLSHHPLFRTDLSVGRAASGGISTIMLHMNPSHPLTGYEPHGNRSSAFITRQLETRTREARTKRAKARPRKLVTRPNLRVTRNAHRALEEGLTKTDASFAAALGIDVRQSTRSVEDARTVNIIFVNKCSVTQIRVASAGTHFGDQG